MPTFSIQHITRYKYDRPVKESISQIKVFPIEDDFQQVIDFTLQISSDPEVEVFLDYYGNKVGDFSWYLPHNELCIDTRMVVRTVDDRPVVPNDNLKLKLLKPIIEKDLQLIWLAEPEKIKSQHIIDGLLYEVDIWQMSIAEIAKACNQYIYENFSYKKGITTVETTIDEILEHKSGVCQDFAHILLQMLRSLGIPSRYVSGYICPNKSGLRGEGATHAWIEYFHPNLGWVGLDPTNNMLAGAYHVRLATGRSFLDCTPVKGAFKGLAQQRLTVFVSVGNEDGHVFENISNVEQDELVIEGTLPWQDDLIAQQQQQQQ